jgi:hypothetical protein
VAACSDCASSSDACRFFPAQEIALAPKSFVDILGAEILGAGANRCTELLDLSRGQLARRRG